MDQYRRQKLIELAGSAEIVVGGLMTAYPQLLPQWIGIVVACGGGVLFVAAFLGLFGGESPKFLRMWGVRRNKDGWQVRIDGPLPFRRLIKGDQAAQIAYNALEDHTTIRISRGLDQGGTDMLALATQMVIGKTVPLFGHRPPSTRLSPITGDLRNFGTVRDAGRTFTNGPEIIENLSMLRRDFFAALKKQVRVVEQHDELLNGTR